MNEDSTPDQSPATPREPVGPPAPQAPSSQAPSPQSPAPQSAARGGHEFAATFTSPPRPNVQSTFGMPGAAPAASAQGAAFGVPTPPEHPTLPLEFASAGPAPTKTDKSGKGTRVAALLVAALLVGGVSGFGGSALWDAVAPQQPSGVASGPETVTVNNPGSVNETTAIASKVLPSVVTIEVAGNNQGGSGSGVIISDDGYVLTNTHVVTLGGATADPQIRVTASDGQLYDATIVGTDPIYDLAVIKLQDAKGLTPIEFADSSKLNVGSTAVAVGAPLGLSNSVTTGVVSALNRSIEIASSAVPKNAETPEDGQQDEEGGPLQFDLPGAAPQAGTGSISISVIQTDAAINHGNSGGALVDSEGKLIGINVAIASAGDSEDSGSIGLGFAIPSNVAKRVSTELVGNGVATHGLLGATVRDAAGVQGTKVAGGYLVDITRGGAADRAGLRSEDIVTEFNGVPITGASDLTAQVRAAAGGSDATLTYIRNGKSYDIELTLGELDS